MSEQFGEILRTAREEKNISVAQVSEALKLSIEKIQEIENSDIKKLPPAAFTCGYLRLFAKLVAVDEEQIIELYYQAADVTPEHVPGTTSDIPVQASTQHVGMRITSIVIIILIFVLTLLWWQDKSDEEISSESVVDVVKEDSSLSEQSVVTDKSEPLLSEVPLEEQQAVEEPAQETLPAEKAVEADKTISAQVNNEIHISEKKQSIEIDAESAEQSIDVEEEQVSADQEADSKRQEIIELARTATPVAEVGVDTIQLNAVDDCWVEISDANNQLLYFSLLKEGEEVHLSGQEPFKVFLGKAQAVQIRINDLPYDVSPYIRSNQVARFTMSMEEAKKMQSGHNE